MWRPCVVGLAFDGDCRMHNTVMDEESEKQGGQKQPENQALRAHALQLQPVHLIFEINGNVNVFNLILDFCL